jgi:hypothetical protein
VLICDIFIGTSNSIMPSSLFLSIYLSIWLVSYRLFIFTSTPASLCV